MSESATLPPPPPGTQKCPKCGNLIGALAGSMDAICRNCGFKDPCCEERCQYLVKKGSV